MPLVIITHIPLYMSFVPLAAALSVTVVVVAACRLPVSVVAAEASIVMLPLTALGVIVNVGSVCVMLNAYLGIDSNVIVEAVQLASVAPRTMVVGCRSGCTTIRVSADCVQHMSSTMAEVMLVAR